MRQTWASLAFERPQALMVMGSQLHPASPSHTTTSLSSPCHSFLVWTSYPVAPLLLCLPSPCFSFLFLLSLLTFFLDPVWQHPSCGSISPLSSQCSHYLKTVPIFPRIRQLALVFSGLAKIGFTIGFGATLVLLIEHYQSPPKLLLRLLQFFSAAVIFPFP